jgi:hypothetical protein
VTPDGQRGILPHGFADLARQVAIWFGFLLLYQLARGVADRFGTAFASSTSSATSAACSRFRCRGS